MQQTEEHQVEPGQGSPPGSPQQGAYLGGGAEVEHHPGARPHPGDVTGQHRQHQHGGDHDFVSGDRHNVGQQDHSIQPQEQSHRIEPMDQVLGDAGATDADVADQPDHGTGRRCEDHRPPEHDEGAVDQRGVQGLQHIGRTIGRQLETEGGGLAPEEGPGQQPGREEHHPDPQYRDAHHRAGRHQSGDRRRSQGPDEDRGHQDLGRPAPVTEREIVGDDRHQPLAGTVDDPGGDHSGRVAAKAHAHRERLLAMGPGPAEERIEVEGDPGQIAEVFQQGEHREEDRHRRQHDTDHPRGGQVDAVEQEAVEPDRQPDIGAGGLEPGLQLVDQPIGE